LKQIGALHFLIVIDQFEELFSLCRFEGERSSLIDNLLVAACEADGPAVVVITLRADFYAHCSDYPQLRQALVRQQEYIGAMSAEELRRAIEEPARRGHWEFEPGLVDLLLYDVGAYAGHKPEPGALPLLSHALLETWRRRRGRALTLSGYTSSGGVRGAIAETAEAVFTDQLSPEQKAIARRIFLRLTELGDETAAGDTRRRATFDELILKPEQATATQTVLMALADARLLTISEGYAEVAHEALIREWPTLRVWLQDNRESLRLHRHLTISAQEWLASDRESDGLYRGARLAQACEWAAVHGHEMNALESEFLRASQVWAEHEAADREKQRQRELEAAQKLADAEKQRAELESKRAEEQARAAGQLRKRALFLAVALMIALVMAFVALFFGSQARQAAISAQDQERVAFSRELAAAAISNLDVDPERSILLASQAVSTTYSINKTWTAEAEDALRRALLASRVELTLRGHTDLVASVAFSPDGKRLATASDDGMAKVWDAATGRELLTISTNAIRGHHGMAFSPDGTRLATAGEKGVAKVWEAATGRELLTLRGHTDWISSVAFSPDGKRLATASQDRTVILWDAASAQEMLTLRGHAGAIWSVAFSPDGTRLVTCSEDQTAKVWDASTGRELLTLRGHYGEINNVAFSPDGSRLATASDDGTAKLWDAETGKEVLTLRGHTDLVTNVAFSLDGMLLATTSFDGKAKVWDTATGQEMFTLPGHTGPVLGVAFSPDGIRLATTGIDGTAKVWNASLSRELFSLDIPEARSESVSPDGTSLAAGFMDGSVKVWDISSALDGSAATSREVLTIHGHKGAVTSLSFSPDGRRLATGSEDQTAKLWDLKTGRELMRLQGHMARISSIAFSPDGTRLATTGMDYTVRVWDVTGTGSQAIQMLSYRSWIWSYDVAFSPDGKRLAAGINDGTGKVWNLGTGKELSVLHGHNGEVWSIAFSPDGNRLATASNDRTAKVWDNKTGQILLNLDGHNGSVNSIAFSPDGTRLATASQDGTVKLWDATTGREEITLYGHASPVADVTFSSDGRSLLTIGQDGTTRLYLVRIQDLAELARRRVTRSFTTAECQQYLHLASCPPGFATTPQILAAVNTPAPVTRQPQAAKGRMCEMTDESGVNDQFYNQIAYKGIQDAAGRFGWESFLLESRQKADYEKNMNQLLRSGCDLIIIANGSNLADHIEAAAVANPGQKFQAVELFYDSPINNIWTQWYAVDQAAFLAGYIAASATKAGKLGTFGGINIPPVTDFMDGFVLGVAYYNQKNGAHVQVLGWDVDKREGLFIDNFMNTNDGRRMAEKLMDEGADIVMPVAGRVGLGSAAAVKEHRNAYLIGVDTDWAVLYPEYANIVLTSVEKRVDMSVVSAVKAIRDGTFYGGKHNGTLENGGVDIAPFHNLEGLITPRVKADLEQIKKDIISGKIKTKASLSGPPSTNFAKPRNCTQASLLQSLWYSSKRTVTSGLACILRTRCSC
jgi:WD40 repeat protein